MDNSDALAAFSALSQPSRLAIFRLLIQHEPEGLRAGEIAQTLTQPQNTISTHLSILQRAGLLTSERQGRVITYRAALIQLEALMQFMLAECCAGRPDLSTPILSGLRPCCMGAKPEG
ncbi:ArsR/SmtB family transcription factor [Asaia krungthepensis]|uniref:ArsR family transcriptional regulator n=1 Tax=Asaia krungthepensis NRIC 0535 TaxID=1307925 RepID=A0ABQ0Q181_9PROT|nr:metalloregulator ArsR/SmtB family transcription factor [Asaia krungthepensis]GBQ86632.1 ArsR family transcriptional regulator [Asaia krungthepensis NRIC 0535]